MKLRPLMEARGIVVHDGRGIRRDKWIPWSSMPERWRQSLPIKRLRLLGRTFEPDDGPAGSVVISEGLWLRRFGGDPSAVGRTITLDGSARTVVGVVAGWKALHIM